MAGLEGYTGPTSGRIHIGGDGEVTRERFTDPPLTRYELDAVEWFTALSPNEQLREVRRLKWNADEHARLAEAYKRVSQEQRTKIARLTAERDARRPDGYELPRSAAHLLTQAERHGWRTVRGWYPDEDGAHAQLKIRLGYAAEDGRWEFQLAWAVPRDGAGAGSRVRSGIYRAPGQDWRDAPSFTRIHHLLEEVARGPA